MTGEEVAAKLGAGWKFSNRETPLRDGSSQPNWFFTRTNEDFEVIVYINDVEVVVALRAVLAPVQGYAGHGHCFSQKYGRQNTIFEDVSDALKRTSQTVNLWCNVMAQP